ncbi:MAG: helix-turn-helix transcriptional regulator [Firmicutes bacterium]|nr:helix-turn-helix transcriptional regulator [Bacillota bacterium]
MDLKKTGELIANERKAAGLTQAELAEKISVSSKAVSRWETGRGLPEASLMAPLCEVLGISVNELLAGERLSAEEAVQRADKNILSILQDSRRFRKRVCALIAAVICLALMYFLYNREFCVDADSNQSLEAAFNSYGDVSNNAGEVIDVLDSAKAGKYLFVLYSSSKYPASSGIASLEKGLFGKYRFAGRSDSSWPLYHMETARAGKNDVLLIYCANVLDENVKTFRLYADGENGPGTGELLYEGKVQDRPFLQVSSSDSGSIPLFATGMLRYYDADDNEVSSFELVAQYPDTGSWSTSTGSMEQWLIYVQEFIVLALGAVFVRYFLSEKKN